jgi:hypothetical protein
MPMPCTRKRSLSDILEPMTKKSSDDLTRPGEPKQKTKQGLEIPVPKTEDFDRLLRKAATKRTSSQRRK